MAVLLSAHHRVAVIYLGEKPANAYVFQSGELYILLRVL